MRTVRPGQQGFTLVETYVAMAIGGAFLMSVLGAWFYTTKIWKEESVRMAVRVGVERGIERLKEDVRLSDYNNILFYPAGPGPYTGISLPRATPDSTGRLTFSSGQIAWDRTVLYHLYDNAGTQELRRTVISGFNSSEAARQATLDAAVAAGSVAGADTSVLCKGTALSLQITPQSPEFDGYAATTSRSGLTSFGSVTLAPGSHEITFETTGKNDASSGYGIGIDSIQISPSGGEREAEALSVAATSGQASAIEDMSAYSDLWGGNHQRRYASAAAGDYLSLDIEYDQWLESNFSNMTHANTVITGTDPALRLASRETQSQTPNWLASSQTAAGIEGDLTLAAVQSVRTVIHGTSLNRAADMVRLKFTAGSGSGMAIQSAYFGVRSGSEALGTGTADFSGTPVLLYFDNAPVADGSPDPDGAVGTGGATSITVGAGEHVWSNWFEYSVPSPAPDYLVSMNVAAGGAGKTYTQTSGTVPVHSYRIDDPAGTDVAVSPWTALPNYGTYAYAFGAVEMAGWSNAGTATSQVYDTRMTSPGYSQISWNASLPAGATVQTKVRTSANADMTGANSWSTVSAYTVSPSSIASLSPQRYIQFQTTLTAASPYTSYPSIDDLSITWPGQSTLVSLSGHYTKKSDYGKFRVLVDGVATVKELEMALTVSQEYRGTTHSFTLNAESKPRNTGR